MTQASLSPALLHSLPPASFRAPGKNSNRIQPPPLALRPQLLLLVTARRPHVVHAQVFIPGLPGALRIIPPPPAPNPSDPPVPDSIHYVLCRFPQI